MMRSRPPPSLPSFLYPRSFQCLRPRPEWCPPLADIEHSVHEPSLFSHHNRRNGAVLSRRTFTTSPSRYTRKQINRKSPAQPGVKTQVKNASFNRGTLDIGLFPEIFIKPVGDRLPSLFGGAADAKERLKIEWHWLKGRVMAFLTLLYTMKWRSKPRIPLRLRERKAECTTLQREMYKALAASDLPTLRLLCADGLYQCHAASIQQRAFRGGKPVVWEFVKYTGRVTVLADLAAEVDLQGLIMRQCVVRIPSRQRLRERLPEGDGMGGRILKETDTIEYVVMQKKILDGEEGEWVLWGTTRPSVWRRKSRLVRRAGEFL